MNLECLNDIIKDRLAIHIDLSDQNSWNLNTGLTATSLTQWTNAKSANITLYDYGLTQFDNGATDKQYNSLSITPQDLKFEIKPIGYNNSTGGTFNDIYPITGVTVSNVGNYFELNGGYLQGFFKLEDYNFEQLPARFAEGVTIETLIRIDSFNNGIFLYMGARAEDKYNTYFSGETELILTETTITERSGIVGQTTDYIVITSGFSGVSTSEGNYLNAYIDTDITKSSFIDPKDRIETKEIEQLADSISDNVIAFGIQSDGRMFIKKIDENGLIRNIISPNQLINTGWTIISIVYKPDEIINDPDLLKCKPARNGTLRIFSNGRLFWKIENFKEFFFKGMKNDREKQIGVPYNISFGGGSFGLKHSWHYDLNEYIIYSGNDLTYIDNNFNLIEYPFKSDPCDTILDISNADIGGVQFSADTTTFNIPNDCDSGTTNITTLKVEYTGTTAQTTGNQYYVELSGTSDMISNRDYNFSLDFYDTGIFSGTTNTVKIIVYGNNDMTVVEESVYIGNNINEWNNITLKIRAKENIGLELMKIGLLIESDLPLTNDFVFYVKDWSYVASDVLSQDSRKNNLLIEQNFNSSFYGGIQKLRIYDIAFTNEMILHNAKIESNKNDYGFIVKYGGRIINR